MNRRETVVLEDVTLACRVVGEGPVVMAVHGFPDTPETFRKQVPALVEAGYQVVLPTLRGYAPSGVARSGRYDAVSVVGDLLQLAERYSPGRPVRWLGHDVGGVMGYVAAGMAPERISHFASLAIPHVRASLPASLVPAQARRASHVFLFQVPFLGEARLRASNFALVERLWRKWSPGYQEDAAHLAAVKEALRGREREVLSYYRALSSLTFGRARRWAMANVEVPTLHLHGAQDGTAGPETYLGQERFFSGPFSFRLLEGAGHFLHLERPREVNAALLEFFGKRFEAHGPTAATAS
ncbi:alpha/beta fold hydrolase [Pyxidicoccus xibeiensis]|uniref:alpha/beta fold hydrolase n=1 Tax=Pyxidicoccus xibeiensis TaxID=2906759 RepID=UPI0020A737D6|nr:alpha/beta hydrolase [Pyxidicoccus xibeiensis]MCP3138332.1 alpha/beta hydrolase [Pyxidicoccus xibeiensis]